jgi:hypothetical protein
MVMGSRLWGLLTGLGAFTLALILLWPSHCIAQSDGQRDPVNFWKECESLAGFHITLPYNSPTSDVFTFRPGATSPNWPPILLWALAIGGAVGIICSLIFSVKRRGLDNLLAQRG